MLSSADMARIFNMTPNSVWHAARAGRLPKPVEIGERGRRWLEADIRDFINRQRGAS